MRRIFYLVSIGGLMLPFPAHAHHSFAMYDQTKLLTVKGTVVEWVWANPHVSLTVEVENAEGTKGAARWVLAGQSVSTWARIGLHAKDIKAGDMVSLQFSPAKDGSKAGYFRFITIANGKTFGEDPTAVSPGDKPRDTFANPLEAPTGVPR